MGHSMVLSACGRAWGLLRWRHVYEYTSLCWHSSAHVLTLLVIWNSSLTIVNSCALSTPVSTALMPVLALSQTPQALRCSSVLSLCLSLSQNGFRLHIKVGTTVLVLCSWPPSLKGCFFFSKGACTFVCACAYVCVYVQVCATQHMWRCQKKTISSQFSSYAMVVLGIKLGSPGLVADLISHLARPRNDFQ